MLDPYVPSRSFEVPCVINPWTEGHSANTNDSLAYGNGMVCERRNETCRIIVFTGENRGSRSRPILLNRGPSPPWSILARQQDGLFMKWRVISAVNDTGTAGVDREESCGKTAKSHPSRRKSRKKSVGSTKTCRASPKPASRPSSHQSAAVSGKSQVVTWCQTAGERLLR